MSKENQQTLEVYESYLGFYLNGEAFKCSLEPGRVAQKNKQLKDRLRFYLDRLSPHPSVLEIGAGPGNDVGILTELGCRVTVTDGAQSFVDYMKEHGIIASQLNILRGKIKGDYNCVYARNVFVHFTTEDTVNALYRIFGSLKPGGFLIFDVPNLDAEGGKHSGWIDLPGGYHIGTERYFHYWRNTEIIRCVEESGFAVKYYDVDGGDDGRRWIHLCAAKT